MGKNTLIFVREIPNKKRRGNVCEDS